MRFEILDEDIDLLVHNLGAESCVSYCDLLNLDAIIFDLLMRDLLFVMKDEHQIEHRFIRNITIDLNI